VKKGLNYLKGKGKKIAQHIINRHMIFASLSGIVPIFDIIMGKILTENMIVLLNAIFERKDFNIKELFYLLATGTAVKFGYLSFRAIQTLIIAYRSYTAGSLIVKILDLSLVGLIIGEIISIVGNGAFLKIFGEIYLASCLKNELELNDTMTFKENNLRQQLQEQNIESTDLQNRLEQHEMNVINETSSNGEPNILIQSEEES